MAEEDKVTRPPYYVHESTGIECIDIVEKLGFNLGSAVAYVWRAGKKPGPGEASEAEVNEGREHDLKKAIWYLRRFQSRPDVVIWPPDSQEPYNVLIRRVDRVLSSCEEGTLLHEAMRLVTQILDGRGCADVNLLIHRITVAL